MNTLPDIDEVAPLSEEDETCIEEIREILVRHGKISRFGLTLLHNHFNLNDDEVLIETCDQSTRTLTLKPVQKGEISNIALVETSWRLDVPGPLAYCLQACQKVQDYKTGKETHRKLHDVVRGK